MYRVTVTTCILSDKKGIQLVLPVFIWLFLFFLIFIVMGITDIYFLLLPMGIEFLCIIPIFIWGLKKSKQVRQECVRKMDVMLTIKDGALYKDNWKLNVYYNERENQVYLDNMHDAGKHNHYCITFQGSIDGNEVRDFLEFCQNNRIPVEYE